MNQSETQKLVSKITALSTEIKKLLKELQETCEHSVVACWCGYDSEYDGKVECLLCLSCGKDTRVYLTTEKEPKRFPAKKTMYVEITEGNAEKFRQLKKEVFKQLSIA